MFIVVIMALMFRVSLRLRRLQDTTGLQEQGFAGEAERSMTSLRRPCRQPAGEGGLQSRMQPTLQKGRQPIYVGRASRKQRRENRDGSVRTCSGSARLRDHARYRLAALLVFYATFKFARLEIFKMLLSSFFPLALLIIAVLGSIVFVWLPSEAARSRGLGGLLLAAAYGQLNTTVVRDSVS